MLLLIYWDRLSALDIRYSRMWCMPMTMLGNWRVGFLVNWFRFWNWATFDVIYCKYLKNCRWLKCWTTCHALVCNMIYNPTEIKVNHRLFNYNIWNNWINICLRHTNTTKRKFQIILGVLNSERLMLPILRWYWSMMYVLELPIPGEPGNWTIPLREYGIQLTVTHIITLRAYMI